VTAITDYHRAFARAVVALAREHQMTALNMTFRTAFSHPAGDHFGEEIRMAWSEGRHGDTNNISLECRAHEGIPEQPKEPRNDR
jgi:hypothetical protein